jgi:hypothetical protein
MGFVDFGGFCLFGRLLEGGDEVCGVSHLGRTARVHVKLFWSF